MMGLETVDGIITQKAHWEIMHEELVLCLFLILWALVA